MMIGALAEAMLSLRCDGGYKISQLISFQSCRRSALPPMKVILGARQIALAACRAGGEFALSNDGFGWEY